MAYKTWASLEVFTAAALNEVISWTVPRFTSTGARDTAIPSPVVGQLVYVTGIGIQIRTATGWGSAVMPPTYTTAGRSAASSQPEGTAIYDTDLDRPLWSTGSAWLDSVSSVAGRSGAVSLVKADVGLGNVDNTSDANKPISTVTQTALDGKASKTVDNTGMTAVFSTTGWMAASDLAVGSSDTRSTVPYGVIGGKGVNPGVPMMILRAAASQTADLQQWQNSAGTVLARLAADGKLGIGGAPAAHVHIIDGSSAAMRFEKTGSNAGTFQIYNDGLANIVGPGSSPDRRFAFYDQMGAGNPSNVAKPPYCNFNDVNTGIYFPDNSDKIGIVTGGVERLRVDDIGGVTVYSGAIDLNNGTAGGVAVLSMYLGGALRAFLKYDDTASTLILDSDSSIDFQPNNTRYLRIQADGKLIIGNPGDVNLYRSAADQLRTDDALVVGGQTYCVGSLTTQAENAAAYRSQVGAAGPSSEPGLILGGDVHLYRSAANVLRTDDGLEVGGSLFIGNQAEPATPSGGGVLYCQSGALKYKGTSGTVTTIAPA